MQLLKHLLELVSTEDTPNQYVDMPKIGVKKRGKGKTARWDGINPAERQLIDTIWNRSNSDSV